MAVIKPEQLSSGPYDISGSFSGSFSGDGSNLINIPTQSFETGSFVTTSSFNFLTSSFESFTGSYNTGSFTGSFTGDGSELTGVVSSSYSETSSYIETAQTASYVLNAVSASYSLYAVSASYEINYETSSSYAETASVAISSSYAQTASYTPNYLPLTGGTISGTLHQSGTFYPDQIDWFSSSIGYDTGSYILTTTANGLTTYANYQDVANTLTPYISTVSSSTSASYADTASYVQNAQTASYVTTAQTASYVLNAVSSSFANTASYVLNAQTASYIQTAQTASYVLNAISSSYALSASYAPSTVSSGPFGIANTSGVYTYYSTFSASMAAATSGQTVEMFADVTETGSVTITLKNGVNINGNGHTYTLNNSGLTHALTVPVTVNTSCNILNLNVVRTGSTGTLFDNSVLILGVGGTGVINCAGSTFRNLGSGVGILFNTNSTHEINYAVAYATTVYGAFGMFTSAGAKLNHCIGYGTGGGYGIRCHNGGDIQNCTGISDSGYGIYGLSGNQSNSVGISTSGNGFFVQGSAYNCVGRSTSGVGFDVSGTTNVVNCVGISTSGIGFSTNLSNIYNCTGISSSSRGIQLTNQAKAYNSIAKSTSSYSILANSSASEIHNLTIISEWNNAGGIGISSNNTTIPGIILNTTFLLSNASAPYLFNNTAAQAVSTRGNTYRGGGAYSGLITQAIVATEDAQGNIFL